MNDKYWEVSGELKAKLFELITHRSDVINEMLALAKKYGAESIALEEGLQAEFVLVFETPPDRTVWKLYGGAAKQYRPLKSSKLGKIVSAEMMALCAKMPSSDRASELIGMRPFNGLRWYTPGCHRVGKRVLLQTPGYYVPPPELQDQIKRISDIAFESLTTKTV